ncbi:MAG: FHA domain-containing protein [Myxococcota bacterium]
MIGIVISEKGGAERRERYHQPEVTIGRVKGNDVLLPKGNVSKRHARLILRDGRYIVTDLKSTNGTYVNHRRITHATLVREGDRIYIGDFVIRIEGEDASSSASASDENGREGGRASVGPGLGSDGVSPAAGPAAGASSSSSSSDRVMLRPSDAVSSNESVGPHHGVVSHFPIEHDPDESSPSLAVPAPPPVPSGLRASSGAHAIASVTHPAGKGVSVPRSAEPPPLTSEVPSPRGSSPVSSFSATAQPTAPSRAAEAIDQALQRRQDQHDALVVALVADIGEERLAVPRVDDATREEVAEKIEAATREAELAPGTDATEVAGAIEDELLALGPLTAVIDDEQVNRIEVGPSGFRAFRRGRLLPPEVPGFADDAGIARTLLRLAHRAGTELPDEGGFVSFALDAGRRVECARPPLSLRGHLLTLTSRRHPIATLERLVRDGALSRGMAALAEYACFARANILVSGSPAAGADEVIEALAAATGAPGRTLWLVPDGTPCPDGVAGMRLDGTTEARAGVVNAAAKLAPEHLVAPAAEGPVLTTLLDRMGRGQAGVIMGTPCATLRQALARLAAEISMTRGGLALATCREWLAASFDLGLEVTRVRDGRTRVVRLVEFRTAAQGVTARDIFTFSFHGTAAGGSVEGTFNASGTVPHIVEDLASRGLVLDPALFRRHPSS